MTTFYGNDHTEESLTRMPMSALAYLHNTVVDKIDPQHGIRHVAKFSDKETGVKRTLKVLDLYAREQSARVAELKAIITNPEVVVTPKEPVAPLEPQPKPADAPKERKIRVPRFVFPLGPEIKAHRPGTARDKAVQVLSRPEGATFEEVAAATGWDKFKKCYEGIRLLHFYLGYGMRQDEAGRIYLRTK